MEEFVNRSKNLFTLNIIKGDGQVDMGVCGQVGDGQIDIELVIM